ncbi:MAG: 23S rRNA (cytosine1962-C5)-methyltransferase, partial [Oceanospirillaceae bacterium]
MPDLILKPKSDRRLRQGHLWIYSNEVDVKKSPLQSFAAGEQVNVLDANGKAIGTAIINPKQLICGRLVSRKAGEPLNLERLVSRLKT